MRRPEARSAGISRPAGVALSFHVSVYKVEPAKSVLARNLLAKDNDRAADLDEIEERGPEMALVVESASRASSAERLARTTSGPYFAVVGPAGGSQSVAPHSNAGEEMALSISSKVSWLYLFDASFIDVSGRYRALLDELSQPRGRLRVDLVVVGPALNHGA